MQRIFRALTYLGLLATMTGCAMCQSGEDNTYAAYGGLWPRHDRVNGRVGSPLSDGGFSDQWIESPSEAAAERGLYQGIDDAPPPPPSMTP